MIFMKNDIQILLGKKIRYWIFFLELYASFLMVMNLFSFIIYIRAQKNKHNFKHLTIIIFLCEVLAIRFQNAEYKIR
jgi:hypothetical protein